MAKSEPKRNLIKINNNTVVNLNKLHKISQNRATGEVTADFGEGNSKLLEPEESKLLYDFLTGDITVLVTEMAVWDKVILCIEYKSTARIANEEHKILNDKKVNVIEFAPGKRLMFE